MTGRELPYIARVSFPLFLLMIAGVMFLYFVPELATFLPTHMKL